MGFDFMGAGRIVTLEDEHESILDLPARYSIPSRFLDQVRARFYGSSVIAAQAVAVFREQIDHIKEAYRAEVEPKIKRTRKVYAADLEIERQILDGLLARDTLYAKLVELRELCDHCIRKGVAIQCEGD